MFRKTQISTLPNHLQPLHFTVKRFCKAVFTALCQSRHHLSAPIQLRQASRLFPAPPRSHSYDVSGFDLGEMVVRGERPGVEDIAINHEMAEEEIEVTGSKTLAEALQYAPGVVVIHGSKNELRISVHGFKSEKSLILIDGIDEVGRLKLAGEGWAESIGPLLALDGQVHVWIVRT